MSQTNNQHFHDLTFTLMDDGTVKLTQTDCGEDYIITAHPEQLRFITRRLCGMNEATASQVQDLERKLEVLTDKVGAFVCEPSIRGEIIERCANGFEFMVRLDALYDLTLEFTGGISPERLLPPNPAPEPKTNKFAPMKPPANIHQLDLPS